MCILNIRYTAYEDALDRDVEVAVSTMLLSNVGPLTCSLNCKPVTDCLLACIWTLMPQ